MRTLQLVGIWCVTCMLWAGPWNTPPAGAQSPSKHRWCVSFHEIHPSLTAREALQKGVPAGYRIYPAPDSIPWEKELLLREEPLLHGGDMADAQPGIDERTNSPIIESEQFRFNAAGAGRFALFTRNNVGRQLAILVHGRVVAAPIINEPILGDEGRISGGLTSDTAAQLANRIRSGMCREANRFRNVWPAQQKEALFQAAKCRLQATKCRDIRAVSPQPGTICRPQFGEAAVAFVRELVAIASFLERCNQPRLISREIP